LYDVYGFETDFKDNIFQLFLFCSNVQIDSGCKINDIRRNSFSIVPPWRRLCICLGLSLCLCTGFKQQFVYEKTSLYLLFNYLY